MDLLPALYETKKKLTEVLGSTAVKEIHEVAAGPAGATHQLELSEKDLRLLRYALCAAGAH